MIQKPVIPPKNVKNVFFPPSLVWIQERKPKRNRAFDVLQTSIRRQKDKETLHDIWRQSPFRDMVTLQINNIGVIGETFIRDICSVMGIDVDIDGVKTKAIGGGQGDGMIMGISVEIKTARQGTTSPSFQHELGEVPWKSARYFLFVDITPEHIYLTIFKNFPECTYKSRTKLPCFPTKSITWRKEKGAFKLDTSISTNEWSVKQGQTLKITMDTSLETVASFIREKII